MRMSNATVLRDRTAMVKCEYTTRPGPVVNNNKRQKQTTSEQARLKVERAAAGYLRTENSANPVR